MPMSMHALFSYSFSSDPSLWWPLFISTATIKGHAQVFRVISGFPYQVIITTTNGNILMTA